MANMLTDKQRKNGKVVAPPDSDGPKRLQVYAYPSADELQALKEYQEGTRRSLSQTLLYLALKGLDAERSGGAK
jgi:hypothetical protein